MGQKPTLKSKFLLNLQVEVDAGRAVKFISPEKVIYIVGEGKYFGQWTITRKPMKVLYSENFHDVFVGKYFLSKNGQVECYLPLPICLTNNIKSSANFESGDIVRYQEWLNKYQYLMTYSLSDQQSCPGYTHEETVLKGLGKELYVYPEHRDFKTKEKYISIIKCCWFKMIREIPVRYRQKLVMNMMKFGIKKGVQATWPKLSKTPLFQTLIRHPEAQVFYIPTKWKNFTEYQNIRINESQWGNAHIFVEIKHLCSDVEQIQGQTKTLNKQDKKKIQDDIILHVNKLLKHNVYNNFYCLVTEEKRARGMGIFVQDRHLITQIYKKEQYNAWHNEITNKIRDHLEAQHNDKIIAQQNRYKRFWEAVGPLPEGYTPMIERIAWNRETEEMHHCVSTYFFSGNPCISIRTPTGKATARWDKDFFATLDLTENRGPSYVLQECRGVSNGPVSDEIQLTVDEITKQINNSLNGRSP